MSQRTGILLVVSGPSGSGKTTLCRRLAGENEAHYSISCTTRSPRPGEIDGKDYHFLSREQFLSKRQNGEFLESAEVHGNLYGTLRSEVVQYLAVGRDVVMDLDVQGAELVRKSEDTSIRATLVDLFVMPANEEELLKRLSGRGTDSAEVIELRMKNAIEETRHWSEYTYRLISGTQEEDYTRFK
ncbi:MAG: guanylate kinase, partial [Akkermansiaceae bacterium]